MLLDGTLMIIAAIMLTIGHPGLTLGEHWHTATFHLRTKKANARAAEKLAMLHSRDNSGINLQETARYERIEAGRSLSPVPPNYEQTGQRYESYRGEP
jgi:hypothetical protein